jgi:hypothetical protein
VPSMADRVLETVERFDYALTKINDADEMTRQTALDSMLTYVYRLREHWIDQLGTPAAYRGIAERSDDGRTTEAVVMVRNLTEHDLTKIVAPLPFVHQPGARTFPGRWTFPGENPTWLPIEETHGAFDGQPPQLIDAYRDHLEGQIVGYAFDAARRFLVESDARIGVEGGVAPDQLPRLIPG